MMEAGVKRISLNKDFFFFALSLQGILVTEWYPVALSSGRRMTTRCEGAGNEKEWWIGERGEMWFDWCWLGAEGLGGLFGHGTSETEQSGNDIQGDSSCGAANEEGEPPRHWLAVNDRSGPTPSVGPDRSHRWGGIGLVTQGFFKDRIQTAGKSDSNQIPSQIRFFFFFFVHTGFSKRPNGM